MTEDEIDAMVNAMLPEWAVGKADPTKWELGAQLPTKDGRRIGNAHITSIMPAISEQFQTAYTIITDAGTRMVCTARELEDFFHPPRWLSDPEAALKRFERIDHLDY